MRASLTLLICITVATAPSGLLSVAQSANVDDQINEWWSILEAGGVLRAEVDDVVYEIPLQITSTLLPQDDMGVQDPAHAVIILRGSAAGATAAVVLAPGRIAAFVNGPNGETLRLNVPPLPDLELVSTHEHVPWRGPLVAEEYSIRVGTPPLFDHDRPMGMMVPGESPMGLVPAGMENVEVKMLHFSPPGGHSVHISKHIWKAGAGAKDPVNAWFFHHATIMATHDTLVNAGWGSTICGSEKVAWFDDAMHGGSTDWFGNWQHHHKESNGICGDARYHIREFPSETGDTHSPGFEQYTLTPVHWEDTGHAESSVNPQKGQDKLLVDMSGRADIGNIHTRLLPKTDSECSSCARWLGWVDIYNRIDSSGNHNPCGNPQFTHYGGSVMHVSWTC